MRFEPLTEGMSLPAIGSGAEQALWDLKQGLSTKPYHLAKDVAAFANHYGGTLLIGAEEEHEQVKQYHPMTIDTLRAAEAAFHSAVTLLCSPKPQLNYARFEKDSGWVLAVNVWPSIATIIGVKVLADKQRCGYGADAYVFPVRIVNHSDTITPAEFPMHMLPALRRTLLLLYAIPTRALITLFTPSPSGNSAFDNSTNGYRLSRIDEPRNVAVFMSGDNRERRVALDAVLRVHCDKEEETDERWTVTIQR
jgi:hypothetical protein